MQMSDFTPLYLPPSHVEQIADPVPLRFPAIQSTHNDESSELVVPLSQNLQLLDADGEYVPPLQIEHVI